jgi:hypothetical protein
VHDHREQEPLRIDRYVPFATFDLLPRVVAAREGLSPQQVL